jgi:hypothetical protein
MNEQRAWKKFGVELPNGTRLFCKYSSQELEGEIVDGVWLIGGVSYNSPTTAAVRNLTTREGYPSNLNGWKLWKVKRPSDHSFIPLVQLRDTISPKTAKNLTK